MSLFRDTTRGFDKKLRTIDAAVGLPAAVVDLQTRLAQVHRNGDGPVLDRLVTAVVDGDTTADLDLLWACALAENAAGPADHNGLLTAVRSRIHDRLRAEYADHAATTYAAVAAKFNTAAEQLTACAQAVDIDALAEAVVTLPDKPRKAWREAQTHADELAALLPALRAAAELAGLIDSDNDESQLALVARLDGVDPGEAFDAWTIENRQEIAQRRAQSNLPFTALEQVRPSRCGRWSALLKAGAVLRAATFEDYVPFVKPKPPAPITVAPVRERIVSPRIRVRT